MVLDRLPGHRVDGLWNDGDNTNLRGERDRSGLVALEEAPEEPIYSSLPEIYRQGPRIRPGA